MNFGESLAYWYFRLNGFFILRNYVVHRGGENGSQPADIDLLCARFPFVYEEVGGGESDWDTPFFNELGIPLGGTVICCQVEVKTGSYSLGDLETSFSLERIRYALERMGIIPVEKVEEMANSFLATPVFHINVQDHENPIFLAKILVADRNPPAGSDNFCIFLSLDRVNKFIDDRLENYIDRKHGERLFFPSELLQYAIWLRKQE